MFLNNIIIDFFSQYGNNGYIFKPLEFYNYYDFLQDFDQRY